MGFIKYNKNKAIASNKVFDFYINIIMYLEKLEIQGFKSFAGKNKLVFPGFTNGEKRGITAVVGPNGSGKSNIADAVRWALGEQSMKTLRAKMGEDVIFSGNKNKQNLAEVSLFLNNEDKRVDIPYSELVLTRRVYRNGENEYLINNSKTKLAEVQMLLARANVGQKTYSVIGQGMVESFLKTTPAERKDFFDEATGIKELQIKRENSLNKLINSHKNLEQAKMIITEIEPRLKSLTRQVNKLQKKGELESELKKLQTQYFQDQWHYLNDKFNQFQREYRDLETQKNQKEEELAQKNREFNNIQEQKGLGEEFNQWSQSISDLQQKRENLIRKLSSLEAQKEVNLEQEGKFDLSWLESQKKELQTRIDKKQEELNQFRDNLKIKQQELDGAQANKKEIGQKVEELNQQLFQIMSSPSASKDNLADQTHKKLDKLSYLLKEIEIQDDITAIKKKLAAAKERIADIIKLISGQKEEEEASARHREQETLKTNLQEWQEKLKQADREQNQKWVELNSGQEKKKVLEDEIKKLQTDLGNIEDKIQKYSHKQDQKQTTKNLEEEKKKLDRQLEDIDKEMKQARRQFDKLASQEEERKAQLTQLQQESQILQKEISELNTRLNELKINSTKYETKLEDLESEVRHSWVEDLEEVKQNRPPENLDPQGTANKIDKIQSQLSQIGAIDPETEQEYYQTKEKYDFLTEQISDLKKAINSLESIIKELDGTIKQKFDREFKKISQKFEQYFKILFNGGSAKIIKIPYDRISEEEEEGEEGEKENKQDRIKQLSKYTSTGVAGIDIQVNPPGKKITSLSMLSGGEKALTAIALICAIISSNPSPFVVLDEVDAALDEANSQRLAQILEDLAYKTQFILITHNRSSMHKANVLYGATMDNNGVSKLLSIKLEDAATATKK